MDISLSTSFLCLEYLALTLYFLEILMGFKAGRSGTEKMRKISGHIAEGAMAFLKSEYKVLIIFVICVAILLAVSANAEDSSPLIAVSFLVGAFCSALSRIYRNESSNQSKCKNHQRSQNKFG